MKTAPDPARAFLQIHGLTVEPAELQAMLRFAVLQLQESLYPSEPRADLSEAEAEALARGGLDLGPRREREESALARTTARYGALLETSLTSVEAAGLGVESSRVRQRLAQGTLYGIRTPQGCRLPAFQFLEEGPLPGIGEVLPHLDPHLYPVAVHNFFLLPNVDLPAEELGRDLSPREWLGAGYPPRAVAGLAAGLE